MEHCFLIIQNIFWHGQKISQDIRHHGIDEEELHEHINGVPNNKVVEYMFGGTCDPFEMEKYSQLKEEYYRQFCKEDQATFHLVKGAEEYFDYLKESNIPFTIASASIKPNIDFFCRIISSRQMD